MSVYWKVGFRANKKNYRDREGHQLMTKVSLIRGYNDFKYMHTKQENFRIHKARMMEQRKNTQIYNYS